MIFASCARGPWPWAGALGLPWGQEGLRGPKAITLSPTLYMGIPLAESVPKVVPKIWVLVGR